MYAYIITIIKFFCNLYLVTYVIKYKNNLVFESFSIHQYPIFTYNKFNITL